MYAPENTQICLKGNKYDKENFWGRKLEKDELKENNQTNSYFDKI